MRSPSESQYNNFNEELGRNGLVDCLESLQHSMQIMLTSMAHRLARCQKPWLVKIFIRIFLYFFDVKTDELHPQDVENGFASFNAFFTRRLHPKARRFYRSPKRILSPVDGIIVQHDAITHHRLIQAKGRYYQLQELLHLDKASLEPFKNATSTTIYLAPYHYHRIHMPIDARLISTCYIPGMLYSVNPHKLKKIDSLFARNERFIMHFQTAYGPLMMVLVGACMVKSIYTQLHQGLVADHCNPDQWQLLTQPVTYEQGCQIAHFEYGSTVIMITPPSEWVSQLQAGQHVALYDTCMMQKR